MIKTELTRRSKGGIVYYTFPQLDELKFMRHWITTRSGGVSSGGYASLNLGGHVGDEPAKVALNRSRLYDSLNGGLPVYLPEQTHSPDIVEIDSSLAARCECDAVLLARRGLAAGVLTADCLPIIVADLRGRGVAVVHAGRAGVFKKIVVNSVERMVSKLGSSPEDLLVAIGPGIRSCCYEVSADTFTGNEEYLRYFSPSSGVKGLLDMVSAVSDQLVGAGIEPDSIYDSAVCTMCRKDEFYSHRAETLAGGMAGRFMTGVVFQ